MNCSTRNATEVPAQGLGSACSVLVSQANADPGGWTIALYAMFPWGDFQIDTITVSPRGALPGGRVAAVASIPGALCFRALVVPPAVPPPEQLTVAVVSGFQTPIPAGASSVIP